MLHCHWSQSTWALCQGCHGPLMTLPAYKHTHTHTQMGPYKPLYVPWAFAPLSALVGRVIKGSTPTWEQYLSSPECPQISLCLTQSPLQSLFSLLFSSLVCPALCPSSLRLSILSLLSIASHLSFPPLFSAPGLFPCRPFRLSPCPSSLSQTGCIYTAVRWDVIFALWTVRRSESVQSGWLVMRSEQHMLTWPLCKHCNETLVTTTVRPRNWNTPLHVCVCVYNVWICMSF